MERKTYSITAYRLIFKEREKSPKGKTLEDLTRREDYLINKRLMLDDFYSYINSKNYYNKKYFLGIDVEKLVINNICADKVKVRYGRCGREFTTIDEYSNQLNFDEKTKYVCNYIIYFFIINNEIIMVSFKYSNYGCKTAIANELQEFLSSTNIIFETKPTANEKFINEMLEKADFETVSFDKIVEIDDGEGKKRKKEVCSSTMLKLKSISNQNVLSKLVALLRGETKENLISELEYNTRINKSFIDYSSIKTTLNVDGIKRVVYLEDIENIMYDIDVTNKLLFDENGYAIQDSVNDVVFEYVEGIKVGANG